MVTAGPRPLWSPELGVRGSQGPLLAGAPAPGSPSTGRGMRCPPLAARPPLGAWRQRQADRREPTANLGQHHGGVGRPLPHDLHFYSITQGNERRYCFPLFLTLPPPCAPGSRPRHPPEDDVRAATPQPSARGRHRDPRAPPTGRPPAHGLGLAPGCGWEAAPPQWPSVRESAFPRGLSFPSHKMGRVSSWQGPS